MSTEDKLKNATEKATGATKETVGKVTGDDSMRAEGKLDQAKADLKQSGEKLKDAVSE
ncbi:MAG: CsbD family protein [Frankiales bacterium]|nr:CsbD family protein [Frankiales bacterium]